MAAETLWCLNQQHVFSWSENMHMISIEAAGLKPEAVVSYIQEMEGGRRQEGQWSPSAAHFFSWRCGPLDGVEIVPLEQLEECKTCLLCFSPLPRSLMFLPLPSSVLHHTQALKHRLFSLCTLQRTRCLQLLLNTFFLSLNLSSPCELAQHLLVY